ncbi:MAG: cysteine synthase A [Candidatus Eisenbacteria bacterium]|nr:cysteine synthase A [Candidatus Eisenbacteria bacterium]
MARIYNNILETIGRTPLVRAPRFSEGFKGDVLFKLESFNPMSSVKDRPALAMIEDAIERGLIKEGTTVIEPTSGNTGVGLALVCAARGIRLILTMPDTMSLERRKIVAALGAELVLTEGAQGMKGAITRAEELQRQIPDSIIAGQFVNPANPRIHRETTAVEVWDDTDGAVDVFVAGIGTGGTITGVGEFLKEKKPGVKVAAVEPADSAILSGGQPGPHKIQGIGAGFVPEILDTEIYDEVVRVTNEDAFTTSRALCSRDGMMVGISSGAVAWAAGQIAQREEMSGKMIVALLASHGERYLSTPLYD